MLDEPPPADVAQPDATADAATDAGVDADVAPPLDAPVDVVAPDVAPPDVTPPVDVPVDVAPVVDAGVRGRRGTGLVSSGEVMRSPSYRMVSTLGQSSIHQTVMRSTGFRLRGGLVGATGGSR